MAVEKFARRALAAWGLVAALFCLSGQARATSQLDIVVNDFAVMDGYVVALKGDDYLIDLDESKHIQAGDLIAVLGKGEPVVHPISGKTIGNLDTIKAVLKITRPHSGFSYARTIGEPAAIAIGDPVRRYGGLPVYFTDHTGKGRQLWQMLQRRLPDLVWKEYQAVDAASGSQQHKIIADSQVRLHFILTPDALQVIDSKNNPLHEYAVVIDHDDRYRSQFYSYRLSRVADASRPMTSPIEKTSHPPAPAFERFDWSSARPVGEIEDSVVMADFVGNDGDIYMATTNGAAIDIFKVSEAIIPVAKTDNAVQDQILYLKWWRPTGNSALFLAASIWSDNQLSGEIFSLKDNRLTSVFKRPGCMLGAFDFDGDQVPETLLAQQFDPDAFFGYRIYQLAWHDTAIEVSRPDLTLPLNFTVSGSQFADLTSSGSPESILVRNGVLNIYAGTEALYESPQEMGGSLSVLTYQRDPSFKDFILTTAFFEIAPVAADMDNDGTLELLAIASDRSSVSAPGAYVNFRNIRFVSFKYADGRFIKRFLSEPLDTHVQGLAIIDKRIFYIVTELRSTANKTGHSRLFELKLEG